MRIAGDSATLVPEDAEEGYRPIRLGSSLAIMESCQQILD